MHRHNHHHASSVGNQVKTRKGQLSRFLHRSKELRGIRDTIHPDKPDSPPCRGYLLVKENERMGVTYLMMSTRHFFVTFSIGSSIYPPFLLLTREKLKR